MMKFKTKLWNFLCSEDGPTAVEYAFMLALIIMVCIGSVSLVGSATSDQFSVIANSDALTGAGP